MTHRTDAQLRALKELARVAVANGDKDLALVCADILLDDARGKKQVKAEWQGGSRFRFTIKGNAAK